MAVSPSLGQRLVITPRLSQQNVFQNSNDVEFQALILEDGPDSRWNWPDAEKRDRAAGWLKAALKEVE
jgi:hypothetical protein